MADIIWKEVEKKAIKNVSNLIFNCELNFNMQVITVANDIFDNGNVKVVLLAGPSSSGKTTSCNLLASRLEFLGTKVHRISTDDFFINREDIPYLPNGLQDFDSINAIDLFALQSVIRDIMAGKSVQLPRFDFLQGKSFPDGEIIEMTTADIVIIEGIHAHNPIILAGCDNFDEGVKKIYIAPRRSFNMENGVVLAPDNLRLLRRLIRDYYTRGHSFEKTLRQWDEVLKAEEKYIKPYISYADYHIDSVYDYELIVYKQCIYNKIKNVAFDKLKVIIKCLEDVNSMYIDSIPSTSLLNEFVHMEREE